VLYVKRQNLVFSVIYLRQIYRFELREIRVLGVLTAA